MKALSIKGRGVREAGMALLLCLLMMTVLSLLALSGASDSQVQTRMSANLAERAAALQAAHSALAWAEDWLLGLDGQQRPAPCTDVCSAPDVIRAAGSYPPDVQFQSRAWWLANGHIDGADPASGVLLDTRAVPGQEPGRFIVQEVHVAASTVETAYYRVCARGSSGSGERVAVLETVLARPWGDPDWSDAFPSPPGTASFCQRVPSAAACGRLAWRRRR